jgi:hypothetical protein
MSATWRSLSASRSPSCPPSSSSRGPRCTGSRRAASSEASLCSVSRRQSPSSNLLLSFPQADRPGLFRLTGSTSRPSASPRSSSSAPSSSSSLRTSTRVRSKETHRDRRAPAVHSAQPKRMRLASLRTSRSPSVAPSSAIGSRPSIWRAVGSVISLGVERPTLSDSPWPWGKSGAGMPCA